MLHLSNYQLRMELDNLKRDLEYNYGQYGVMGFNGYYNQFHVELYNWKLARVNALETYVNAQFMVSRMEQQAQYAANVRPRWRSKPKRKQIMPPKNKFNYNNNNLSYVSKQPNNVLNPPNNDVSKPPNNNNVSKPPNNNNNVTRPSNKAVTTSNNVTFPRAIPESFNQTPPRIDNVQIKQEPFDPFDANEGFIINIKQEKPDNGYENVTKWVDDVNLNLNIKQEKVDPRYEVGQKRKCSSTNNCNSKKAKFHSDSDAAGAN